MGSQGNLVIFGVGNMLGDVFDCALALGHRISGVVLNQAEVVRPRTKSVHERIRQLARPPRLLDIDSFVPQEAEIYVLGTTHPNRSVLVEDLRARFGIVLASLVHPTAFVSPLARLGEGVYIGALSVVAPGAVLHDHVFVNRGVTIGHDTVVEPFVRIGPGCHLAGHVVVGRGTTIGIGATIIEELMIGSGAVIAAGAVVINDIEAGVLAAGVPATAKRYLDPPGT
jgi:sugar O-acyltransferase (sialic acid O-acetyltransferase NeuD family)